MKPMMKLCTQSGTHIQGPHYFLKDEKKINKFPISSFEGKAIVIDIEKRGYSRRVKKGFRCCVGYLVVF